MNKLVADGRYSEAASLPLVNKDKEYGDKNTLLYHLDRGMLLHLSGNYTESNFEFEKAKTTAENYFTKSITTEASTFLINDTMTPYYGEDFERALIHIFSALNYISLGKEQEALVEARQVDHFLTTLETNYGYKNVYKEDAFVRYLMGMLYENQGEINDAFISYRKALETYESYQKVYFIPPSKNLIGDIIHTANLLGFDDEISEVEKKWKVSRKDFELEKTSKGELVVINYNGISPEKVDDFFEISFGKGWAYVGNVTTKGEDTKQVEQASAIARSIMADEQIRIAFPKYTPVEYNITGSKIIIDNSNIESESGVLVQDIGTIAVTGLQDRINRIRAKAIARAAIKYALSKKIVQKISENQRKGAERDLVTFITKAALNTVSTVMEHADTRSWRSLPDKIYIHRIPLSEGIHTIKIKYFNKTGSVLNVRNIDNINIKSGKKTFIITRTAQ
ncbi:hypothetical protein HY745_13470 [Candidatus Desantisbacteria bacterium]|nr:hypothetical protein [Candidatus Desantisbacteria bacterium]